MKSYDFWTTPTKMFFSYLMYHLSIFFVFFEEKTSKGNEMREMFG